MSVRAKFICNSIVDTDLGGYFTQRVVKFNAVHSSTGENADFASATPWGNVEMMVDKSTPAYTEFKVGDTYYLTFEKTNN